MANLNKAPSMGETEDDDSNESPDIQPVFLSAAFEADKRAKEQQALQEENQRRILEFLSFGSEDDEDDEEDGKSESVSKSSNSKEKPAATATQTEEIQAEATEAGIASGYEGELNVDHSIGEDIPTPEESGPETEVGRIIPDYDQWAPNQGEAVASLDPDSSSEVFEQTSIGEELPATEESPRVESGMNNPPPPPEEPPTANNDSFDMPPPSSDQETQFEQPPEEPIESNPEPIQEVIVERHKGGVGAALMAFFAANWLSRRRDRKLRRETQKLEKNFQKSQEEAESERRYVRQVERKSESIRDEHKSKLSRLERAQAESSSPETPDNLPEPKEGPVPLAEVLAATAYAKGKESPPPERSEEKKLTEEVIVKKESEQETIRREVAKETETDLSGNSAESHSAGGREDAYESKKDVKANPILASADSSPGTDKSALDAAEASLNRRYEDSDLYKIPMAEQSAAEGDDLYQKSITSGVAVGVALVVLVAAVYLLF
jgi:hypothetical protein